MIDLHMHTIYSDGEYTPMELLKKCNDNGVTTMAITDHNSIEGTRKAILENPYKNIRIISGIELGAICPIKGGTLHILGYGIDLMDNELNNITCEIMKDNIMRLKSCVELVEQRYNITFDSNDLEKIYSSVGNIGRPDLAKLCVKYGYTKNVEEAFKKYLVPIKDDIKKRRVEFTADECIKYITGASGAPCLAHPIEIGYDLNELRKYIEKLISYGLQAVEVYQSKHSKEYSKDLMQIVNDYGLLYSVGSDYHGKLVTPDFEIGYGHKNNLCKDEATILEYLLE